LCLKADFSKVLGTDDVKPMLDHFIAPVKPQQYGGAVLPWAAVTKDELFESFWSQTCCHYLFNIKSNPEKYSLHDTCARSALYR